MNVECITSKEAILDWVRKKYTTSKIVPLETGFTIIWVTVPTDYKIDTESDAFTFTEKKSWEAQLKRYNKCKGNAMNNLSSYSSVRWEQLQRCHWILQGRHQSQEKDQG